MTSKQKQDQISRDYSKRSETIRQSDKASAGLKNRALSPAAERRLARTKEGRRMQAMVEKNARQSANANATISGGKGSKSARRAVAMGLKKKRGRPSGPSGGKVGSSSQQKTAARQQAARQRTFSSKSTAGRSAKAAWRASQSNQRADKRAERMGGGKSRKPSRKR